MAHASVQSRPHMPPNFWAGDVVLLWDECGSQFLLLLPHTACRMPRLPSPSPSPLSLLPSASHNRRLHTRPSFRLTHRRGQGTRLSRSRRRRTRGRRTMRRRRKRMERWSRHCTVRCKGATLFFFGTIFVLFHIERFSRFPSVVVPFFFAYFLSVCLLPTLLYPLYYFIYST